MPILILLATSFLSTLHAAPAECANDEETGQTTSVELSELSLEELMNVKVATVYGASRFQQNVSEAPSSVSIVTADEIKKFGYRTLADIINSQRGLFTTNDRNYTYIGARGVDRSGGYSNRILILVDGHRTNENVYGTAFVGHDFVLDVDLIERVEIIRGPGSSLYGDNAFFGVINVITRHDNSLQGVEVSGNAGSLESYQGRISYGKRFNDDFALSLSGTIYDSRGNRNLYYPEYDTPEQNNGVARNLDYERNYSFFSTATLKDFTLQGTFVKRTKGVPTASYGATFNDHRFHSVDYRGYLDLKYEHTFNEWETMARGYYDYYDYFEDIPFNAESGDVVLNRDSAENHWWGTEVKLSRTLWEKHRVIVGADFQSNTKQQLNNHDLDPYLLHLHADHPTWRWASYLQDEFTLLPNLILNAGVRYDYYNTFGSTVNPRAALIYEPFESTSLKAVYGEAFRAPNSYELYYDEPSSEQKGNLNLAPEKIRSTELIWEQTLGEHVRTTVTGYYNTITKMITQITDPADGYLVYNNSSSVTARGVEAEIEGKWKNGLLARGSYAFQVARDDATGVTLPDSPRHLGKINLIAPCYKDRLFTGVELQYLSKRKTLAGRSDKPHLLTNLTLFSRKLVEGVELSGSIYNLFDVRYGDPGSGEHLQDVIPQDGRLFRIKLTYQF
ncbi:TonB-dependent receptor [Geomonas sp. RF6]|uniref:TonB-dependent receptor plug domain-containing protein n=1 Tax=Geomonas sp. RF6 TaxID=2897342 RepID=UPI001E35384D|nr:TonB-dependent receptor [Geomonas sp. RF6]UFS68795.1 TonB-dependent receptor [Geomonas sp. RF6]